MAVWASGCLSCKVISCGNSVKCLSGNQIPLLACGHQSSAIFFPQRMGFLGGNSCSLGIIASEVDGHRDSTEHTVRVSLLLPGWLCSFLSYPQSETAQALLAVPCFRASALPCTTPASLCFVNATAAQNFSFPTLM
jgi:hypothetical protein